MRFRQFAYWLGLLALLIIIAKAQLGLVFIIVAVWAYANFMKHYGYYAYTSTYRKRVR